jgi:hypothetical protein
VIALPVFLSAVFFGGWGAAAMATAALVTVLAPLCWAATRGSGGFS